ncbi:hypothetical protein V1478_008684 [Vespula squamosa]|uniref:Uncharacterized protein n=1 Tax=Vespula squamosa TaxID=30214 RepID=A0ABD2AU78_VESSQ
MPLPWNFVTNTRLKLRGKEANRTEATELYYVPTPVESILRDVQSNTKSEILLSINSLPWSHNFVFASTLNVHKIAEYVLDLEEYLWIT